MTWFHTIFLSIGAALSSLFGASHTATTSISVSPTPIQQIAQTQQVSDQRSIVDTVIAMLSAERNAVTFQDAENAVNSYASQATIQQFQTSMSKVPTSAQSAMQQELLIIDHAYPDPSSLQLQVTINSAMATATAALPETMTTQPNALGKVIVSTFQNSITVPLQKENGQWKIVKIIMASKGIGSEIKASK